MGDLLHFIKTLVFAAIIVVLLQVKWGGETLESKSQRLLTESAAGEYLIEIAQSGVVAISKIYHSGLDALNIEFDKRFDRESLPGKRSLVDGFERSKSYVKEELTKKENREAILESYEAAEDFIEPSSEERTE